MKNFIASSYDIGFLCSNMRIEANAINTTHTRVPYLIKKLIGGSYDIKFIYSNTRSEFNIVIYDIKFKKCDFESCGVRHERMANLCHK